MKTSLLRYLTLAAALGCGALTSRPAAAQYAAAVQADGPIAYWRFNDPTNPAPGAAKNDGSLGAAADGFYAGGAAPGAQAPRPPLFLGFEPGNTALQLDGQDDFVGTVMGLMNDRPSFTLSGWMRRAADQPERTGLWGQNDLVEFGYIENNTLQAWTDNGLDVSPNPIPNGEWAHLALVSDGPTLTLYTNGLPAASRAHSLPPNNSFRFNIGGGGVFDATNNFFNGQIDEVAVFDKALTAAQIRAHVLAASRPPCAPPPTGLTSWWPGEGNANDVVGTNDGTIQGGLGFGPGRGGTAFSFDGVDDVIGSATPPLTDIQNTFTIECWVWPMTSRNSTPESASGADGTAGQSYAIAPEHGGSSGPAGAGLSVGTNGVSVFEHADGYLPSLLVYSGALSGWTHLAVVYQDKQPKLYVNGLLVRTGLTSPRSSVFPSKVFGNIANYGPYRGLLDEVSIYNRALAANEIAAIYAAGSSGKCPPCGLFQDATFNNSDWTLTAFDCPSDTAITAGQIVMGGCDGGPFRCITNILNPTAQSYYGLVGIHLRNGATHNPSIQPLNTVDYSECNKLFAGGGAGQATGPALKQGGNYYIVSLAKQGTTPQAGWAPFSVNGLTASDFDLVDCTQPFAGFRDSTQHPNFCGGPPLEFGFFRANSSPGTANTLIGGIDDWRVQLHCTNCCVPPSSLPRMVAWWPLDEVPTANIFQDYAGANNALIQPGPLDVPGVIQAYPAGKVAGACWFLVSPGHGRAPNANALNFGIGSFSVDCWFQAFGPLNTRDMAIVDKLKAGPPVEGYSVGINQGYLELRLGDGGLVPKTYTSTLPVPNNAWVFIGVAVDRGGANTVTFQVNGTVQPPVPLGNVGNINSAIDLLIGDYHGANNHTDHLLDEVEMFTNALTTAQFDLIRLADSAGKCKTNRPCACDFFNGDFTLPVPVNGTGGGWTSADVFIGDGWQSAGGNPGGTFLLNNVGDPLTDPTISQRLCCLVPGQCYTIRGQRKVQAWFGNTSLSFAVLLDGIPILSLPSPANLAAWDNFAVTFTATTNCHTLGFASEISGTDVSYWIDNIRLECCDSHCILAFDCRNLPNVEVAASCATNCAVVNYAPPATSTCPPVAIVCAPPSGTCFPAGVTPVICTATDAGGATATCSFTVTVTAFPDTTPPTLDCRCLTNLAHDLLFTNNCPAYVPDLCQFTNCFRDLCCLPTNACMQTPPAGTVVGPGTHPINIKITDCAGNMTNCTVNFVVTCPPPCNTYTNAWNSGIAGPGVPDPNYTLVSAPSGGPCTGPAQMISAHPLWVPNGLNSWWIGAGINAGMPFPLGCQPGVYHYQKCFYLSCTNDASITGQWTADDFAEMYLNGQPTGHTVPSVAFPNVAFSGWHPVSITSGFVCGYNCLDFYVTNAHAVVNPTGFRAELTNVFNDCCCTNPLQQFSTLFSGAMPSGVLLAAGAPDPQFGFVCAPPGGPPPGAKPVVINPGSIPGSWVPNPNSLISQWIGPNAVNSAPGGVYCYTNKFTIPPCGPGQTVKARLTGRWAADDTAALHLNGQPTGQIITTPASGPYIYGWHPVNITSGFVPGVNTLTFYVTNAICIGNNPTGLRVELTNSYSCCLCSNDCTGFPPLTITCPPSQTIGTCGGPVIPNYTVTTAGGGPPVIVTCTPPAGTAFPVGGPYTITCTATDRCGKTTNCSFTVTVQPIVPPCNSPNLSIARVGELVVLSWPAASVGYVLEYTYNLEGTNLNASRWQPVDAAALPQADGRQGVTLPISLCPPYRFFRLSASGTPNP